MAFRFPWILAGLLGITSLVSAQPAKEAANSAEIRFADGSVVRMGLLQDSLEVMTKYGKLTIPVREIRKIEMGLHLPPGLDQQIDQNIRLLSSQVFKQREEASRELVQAGHWALAALQKASRSGDPEVSSRAGSLIKKIQEKLSPEHLKQKDEDTLHTVEFPVVGRILSPVLKAYSPLFGQQDLKLSDLRTIQIRGTRGDREIVVEAAKYGSASDQWMDTGIMVDPSLRLLITSDGQVDLWPQTPGQYMAPPRGYNTPGRGGQFMAGALVGRVGENGRVFLIGERYEGNPSEEGKIYLHIIPSPWNNASGGSFRVRIHGEQPAFAP